MGLTQKLNWCYLSSILIGLLICEEIQGIPQEILDSGVRTVVDTEFPDFVDQYVSVNSRLTQENVRFQFPLVETLNYGDKCNLTLENEANVIREDFKPALAKYFAIGYQFGKKTGLTTFPQDFEFPPELQKETELIDNRIEALIVKLTDAEINGICQTTKSLFCDTDIGECRCGNPRASKGLKYVQTDEGCRYDLGSGCIQTSPRLVNAGCVPGTSCQTGISNSQCNIGNVAKDFVQSKFRMEKLTTMKGYTCFCNKIEKDADVAIRRMPKIKDIDRQS